MKHLPGLGALTKITKDSFLAKHTQMCLCWSHKKRTSVPHTYAIGWSSSSLGTWHPGLVPTPSAVLPNHGGIGPAATIAALSHISQPRLGKLILAFGQMRQASGFMHKFTVAPYQAIFCASVTWLSTVLAGFAVQDESMQTRQLTNASQQPNTLVVVAQRQYLLWMSKWPPTRATDMHTDHGEDKSNVPCLQMQSRLAEGRSMCYIIRLQLPKQSLDQLL